MMKFKSRRLFVFFAITGGCVLWWILTSHGPGSDPLSRVHTLLDRGDRTAALQTLRQHLGNHPDDISANYLAGVLLARTAPEEARRHLIAVPLESEHRAQAVRLLAAIALQQRDVSSAQAYLQELEQHAPEDPAVSLALAECQILAGDYNRALEHARRTAELDPKRAQTFVMIAEILDEQGRVAECVTPLQEAVRLDPELFQARANLAYALHFVGEHKAALEQLKWCLKRQPGNVDLLRIQAEIYRDEGDAAQAKRVLRSVLQQRPQDLGSRILLGEILLFENQPQEALAILEPVFEQNRDSHHLTTLLSRAAWLAGDTRKGRIYQELLLRQLPERRADP